MEDFNLYKEMLDNFHEGVYFVDKSRKIQFWNKGAERISGFKSEEMLGRFCHDNLLNHIDDKNNPLCKEGCPLHKTLQDGERREAGVYLHHKEGHRVSVAVRTIPLFVDGQTIGAAEVFVDNKEQEDTIKKINELTVFALYDQLTELPNRRYIDSYVETRYKEYMELEIPFAVILMDIDHFKSVNDTHGHDAGDRVLKMVAKTLKSAFRKSDLVGRWGGEEFMAVVTSVTQEDLPGVLEKARALVERSLIRDGELKLNVTISLGASRVREDDTVESLRKRADGALYQSKNHGRNKSTIL